MKPSTVPKIVWPAFALICVGYVAGTALSFNLPHEYVVKVGIDATRRTSDLLFSSATFLFGVMGALITLRRSRHRIGWIFLFIGGMAQLLLINQSYTVFAFFGAVSLPFAAELAWANLYLWMPMVSGIIMALLLFPTGRLPSRRWLFVPIFAGAANLLMLVGASLLWPFRGPELLTLDNPSSLEEAPALVETLVNVANPLVGIAIVSAGLSLIFRYRRAEGDERRQLRLFAFAVGVAVSTIGVDLVIDTITGNPAPAWVINILAPLGLLMVPVAAGVAVLRYRLYEIDVVIKKAVAYTALAIFITAFYLAVVIGVGALVGGRSNLLLSIVATALIALGFQPLRNRAHRLANRLVYGQRVSPYEAMAGFSHQMAGVPSLDEVLPLMAETAAKGIGAATARVRVFLPDGSDRASFWPSDSTAETFDRTIPVRYADEEIGEISVSKTAADPISEAEARLLSDLASQAGLALRNVRLTEELRASRQRIVKAQDEERRRMERDIHDGAQQQLVAMSVKLGLVESLLKRDPEKASPLVGQLKSEASEAVETLRDLARGLFPQVLAEKGLAQAVASHIEKMGIKGAVSKNSIPRLNPDLETAVYFVIREALQNASKHASDSEINVELSYEEGDLAFEVRDRGPGFEPSSNGRGSGMQNMRDRIEALGGTFEVESKPGVGTRILGRVPATRSDAGMKENP